MRTRLAFTLRLHLRSPFLFPDPAGARFGIDAMGLRDGELRPLIPADQIRGLLAEALKDLSAAAPAILPKDMLDDLLSEESKSADSRADAAPPNPRSYDPQRAHLVCADLTAPNAPPEAGRAVRVEIEPETGAAKAGHLQIIELVAPPGKEVTFEGPCIAFARPGEAAKLEAALRKALKLVGAIGAQRSVGFGEIDAGKTRLDTSTTRSLAIPQPATAATPASVALRLTLDRPFLVDATREADNLFVGAEIIPGGVIKGALARRLELGGEGRDGGRFADLLAGTRITHAFPENRAGTPAGHALPLSLVAAKVHDRVLIGDTLGMAADAGAMLDDGSKVGNYRLDWKNAWDADTKARLRLGWPEHQDAGRVLRVHTAIHSVTGTADEGRLFATVARNHRHLDPNTKLANGPNRGWRFGVHPPPGADPAAWASLLALLSEGLDGIGRTGASGSVEVLSPSPTPSPNARPVAGYPDRFAVCLTTPAVLTGAESDPDARKAYAAYWDKVCGARMVDHAATQRLAGGYIGRRFRAYASGYVPFVLTDSGSVFLLEGVSAQRLNDLMATGLPLPELGGNQPDWRSCPYVPENGYGAFTADYLADPNGLDEVRYV